MQIRCTHVHRIHQHFVEEANHGRIVSIHVVGIIQIRGVGIFGRCDVIKIEVPICREFIQAFAQTGGKFGDQACELGIFRNDPIDGKLRCKLDFLDGDLVAGICGGNNEAPPFFGEGEQLAFKNEFGIQQVFADLVFVDSGNVQQRQGECLRQGISHIGRIDMARTEYLRNKAAFALACALHQIGGGGFRELAVLNQHLCHGWQGAG